MTRARSAWCRAILLLLIPAAAWAQGPGTGGLVAREQAVRMLGHHMRVLVIGAHPDDEDTELLTVLSRGMGVEAAYLALNRGEGGQNLIGPELGDALGLIRTGELESARSIDGARQYFTRAFDFGYSKTLADTWAHWPQDSILKDVVRVIRRFRPQVVVSVFRGGPEDGHGQHQAAGWAAHEAFRVAGDPAVFPELAPEEHLEPWTPVKLYRSTNFDREHTTYTLDGGALDRAVGQSYHQIAMQSRSRHRSQDMGRLQTLGPSRVQLRLDTDRSNAGTQALFDGIDTSLAGLPSIQAGGPELVAEWKALGDLLGGAKAGTVDLAAVRRRMLAAWPRDGRGGLRPDPVLQDQLRHLDAALAVDLGMICDALSLQPALIPGERARFALTCWNTGTAPRVVDAVLTVRAAAPAYRRLTLAPGAAGTDTVGAMVADSAAITEPYYLRLERGFDGALYTWPAAAARDFGRPDSPPDAAARFEVQGGPALEREVWFRTLDQANGEVRRPVPIAPRISVSVAPDQVMRPSPGNPSAGATQVPVTVRLEHAGQDTTEGVLSLDPPPGWPAPDAVTFTLAGPDAHQTVRWMVTIPPGTPAGAYRVGAVARDRAGRRYDAGVEEIRYPHIRPARLVRPAASRITMAPITLPDVGPIGYVRGAADRVPEALQGLGLPVVLLDHEALERGDLGRYQVIVVGPRAYETDTALVRNNDRLLAWVQHGGHLVVQYQQNEYFQHRYALRPMEMAPRHDRVTDEAAAVTALIPDHPAVTGLHRIGPDDWTGWVQERALYVPRRWDPAYAAVLRMGDPGEAPLDGALLMTRAGAGGGTFTYTGLSFFRQLPAGVPGAMRLFLNILALGAHAATP